HHRLIQKQIIDHNATLDYHTSTIPRVLLDVISIEEIYLLLNLKVTDALILRNKEMIELMYATGIRVSEMISLKITDLHLKMGFGRCIGKGEKERIILLGDVASEIVDEYLNEARPELIKKNKKVPYLFLNHHGRSLTRKGFWKILKKLEGDVGLIKKLKQ